MPDSVNSGNKNSLSDYSPQSCRDFWPDSSQESGPICLHNTGLLLWRKSYHVGKVLITVRPRRGIQRQCRWIWWPRTKLYFMIAPFITVHSVQMSLTPSCQSLPLHMGDWTWSLLLYNPVLTSSGCMATLPSPPLCSAGCIVQQLGMWMHWFLSSESTGGVAYLCLCHSNLC